MDTGGPARFDGRAYAAATAHHRAYDRQALAGLPLGRGTTVLDLGCGVGDLTARVARRVGAGEAGGGAVLGVDASPSCVRVAAARSRAGLAYAVLRAQDLGRAVRPSTFDAVLSVAVLHWVPETDQSRVLEGVARVLRPGGTLRADLGGAGQVAAVRAALAPLAARTGVPECPWFFPSAAQLGSLVVAAGLVVEEVRTVRQRRSVPDADALRSWLVSQVLPAYLAHVPAGYRASFTADAVDLCQALTRRDDGTFDQDYVRIHLLARKRPGGSADMPGAFAVAADVLASTARLLDGLEPNDPRKPLLHKRLRRLADLSRLQPEKAIEGLAQLRDDVPGVRDGGGPSSC